MLSGYFATYKGYPKLLGGESKVNNSLVEKIQNGHNGGTWGVDLLADMAVWVKKNGYNLGTGIDLLPTAGLLYDLINSDRPVVLEGLFPDVQKGGTCTHAVVVHFAARYVTTIFGVPIAYTSYKFNVNYEWGKPYTDTRIDANFLGIFGGAALYY